MFRKAPVELSLTLAVAIQLTNALKTLLKRKKQIMYALEYQGRWHDAGTILGFLKTTVAFALERPDVAPGFREYLRGLDLDSDARPSTGRRHNPAPGRPDQPALPERGSYRRRRVTDAVRHYASFPMKMERVHRTGRALLGQLLHY